MTTYHSFLMQKSRTFEPCGFIADDVTDRAFSYQRDIIRWACRMGRAGIFADTGLGKTLMQTEWARLVAAKTDKPVIILAPLCVAQQTEKEANKFDILAKYCREDEQLPGVVITNYERVDKFDVDQYGGVVLDESSILKSQTSKTREKITGLFSRTPYRLSCTATPSPNDYMELGNQSNFLGLMTQAEMLAMYFIHDGGSTQNWRLKRHGVEKFWQWLAEWGVFLTRPSDLGYDDSLHELPPLNFVEHRMSTGFVAQGQLFAKPVSTLSERRQIKRDTIDERIKLVADMVNSSAESWIVWCDLNDESTAAAAAIPDAVEVQGSHTAEEKESRLMAFANGDARVLITKTSIAGFGMNYQHCRNMAFAGLNDSYESLYQAIRRCWRFGQNQQVNVHLVFCDEEWTIVDNLRRKKAEMDAMKEAMRQSIGDLCASNLIGQKANKTDYNPTILMEVPAWLKTC